MKSKKWIVQQVETRTATYVVEADKPLTKEEALARVEDGVVGPFWVYNEDERPEGLPVPAPDFKPADGLTVGLRNGDPAFFVKLGDQEYAVVVKQGGPDFNYPDIHDNETGHLLTLVAEGPIMNTLRTEFTRPAAWIALGFPDGLIDRLCDLGIFKKLGVVKEEPNAGGIRLEFLCGG